MCPKEGEKIDTAEQPTKSFDWGEKQWLTGNVEKKLTKKKDKKFNNLQWYCCWIKC